MSQTDISISFVIPVLNGQKYMADCIEHIQREMRPQDEIIVVDNGSTDATLEILARYERVKVLSAPRITIGAARNRGAALAKGEVLAFVDSDCLVCEGWRAAAVETLADSSVAATGSKYDISPSPTWVEKAWSSLRKTTRQRAHYFLGGNFVVRKKVFDAVQGFNERLVTDEDSEIGTRLVMGGYVLIDEPGVRVVHMGNAKTIRQYARKQKWHATSILESVSIGKIDKPLLMTLFFVVCVAVALVALVCSFLMNTGGPLWVVPAVMIAPLLTAWYRTRVSGMYRYFPAMTILYFVYYVVRSVALFEALYGRVIKKQRNTGNGAR